MDDQGDYQKVYHSVGTSAAEVPNYKGRSLQVVGILFPVEDPLHGTWGHEDEYDERYLTLAGVKSLIQDLQEAVRVCEQHLADEKGAK